MRILAQLALQYPDAAQSLMTLAGYNRVSPYAWQGIAAALGGEQMYYGNGYLNQVTIPANATDPKTYHIPSNMQSYESVNVAASWTSQQVQSQLALIDRLRAANPAAATGLEGARNALAARLGQ
jgi:hypothetical protein